MEMGTTSSEQTKMDLDPAVAAQLRVLGEQADRLASSVSCWNAASIIALAVAAIAAAAVFITARCVVLRSTALSGVQDQIRTLKEAEDAKIHARLEKAASDSASELERQKQKTSQVESDLAKQQELTATAQRELLEVQKQIAPRRLSADLKHRLVELLRPAPKGPIEVTSVLNDKEHIDLGNDVIEVLRAARFNPPNLGAMMRPDPPIGVVLAVRDPSHAPAHALAIQQAFFTAGFPLPGAPDVSLEAQTVRIIIGNKPATK